MSTCRKPGYGEMRVMKSPGYGEMRVMKSYDYYDNLYDSAGKPHFTGHLPGYTGYSPGRRFTEGLTFGAVTEKINKQVQQEIERKFAAPRGPKCTGVPRYTTCHTLPMSAYKERPQSGTVFANKQDIEKLVKSLEWYSKSSKERALLGRNHLVPHRYKHSVYSAPPDKGHDNTQIQIRKLPANKRSCSTQSEHSSFSSRHIVSHRPRKDNKRSVRYRSAIS